LHQVKKIIQVISGEIPLKPSTIEAENILTDLPEDSEGLPSATSQSTGKLQAQTSRALGRLQPQEAEVLRMSFGLGEETTHTLEEIGRNLNLSREKIRQIQTRALRKLKNMGGNRLRLLNES
jgi:RNA polymerase primary sigma factor